MKTIMFIVVIGALPLRQFTLFVDERSASAGRLPTYEPRRLT